MATKKKRKKMLIINGNLLLWYNELNDELDTASPDFPKKFLLLIEAFGDFTLEYIDAKKTILVPRSSDTEYNQ